MCIEKIGISASTPMLSVIHITEQHTVDTVGLIPVMEPGPEIDSPAGGPAGGRTVPKFERALGCSGQFRSSLRSYMPSRVETDQMGLMPVMRVGILPVIIPFLEISLMANLVRPEPGKNRVRLCSHLLITQHASSVTGIRNAFPGNGKVSRSAIGQAAVEAIRSNEMVLRGGGRTRYQPAVPILHQNIHAEAGGIPEYRPGIALKILSVKSIEIMFPEMCTEPCTSHRPVRPLRRFAFLTYGICHCPHIGIMGAHPATGIPVRPRRAPSVDGKISEETQQRPMHLTEIQHFGRPVVLLGIDVHGIVRAPRCLVILIPEALKIHRNARGAGCGYHKIPSELEIEFFEAGVIRP